MRLGTADGWTVPFVMPPFDPTNPVDPVRLEAYTLELQDLVDAVDEGRPPMLDGVGGQATVAMIDAAEHSARTGEGVRIDLGAGS